MDKGTRQVPYDDQEKGINNKANRAKYQYLVNLGKE